MPLLPRTLKRFLHDESGPTAAEYAVMIGKKTGWYSGRTPCEVGALIGGGSPELVDVLGSFGEKLGVGFQVRDDLLNLVADSAAEAPAAFGGGYGKEHGGDIAEGKRTLIVIEMLERMAPEDGERLKAILLRPPEATAHEDVAWAISRAGESGAMKAAAESCSQMGRDAVVLLEALPASPQRELLRDMAHYLIEERST